VFIIVSICALPVRVQGIAWLSFPEMTYYVLSGTSNLYSPTHSLTTVFGHRQCLKWGGMLVAPLPWPLGRVDKNHDLKKKKIKASIFLFKSDFLFKFFC